MTETIVPQGQPSVDDRVRARVTLFVDDRPSLDLMAQYLASLVDVFAVTTAGDVEVTAGTFMRRRVDSAIRRYRTDVAQQLVVARMRMSSPAQIILTTAIPAAPWILREFVRLLVLVRDWSPTRSESMSRARLKAGLVDAIVAEVGSADSPMARALLTPRTVEGLLRLPPLAAEILPPGDPGRLD